jgi:hypothetical protein
LLTRGSSDEKITQVNDEKPVSKSKSKYDGLLDADDGKNI